MATFRRDLLYLNWKDRDTFLLKLNQKFCRELHSIFGQLQHCKSIPMNRSKAALDIAQTLPVQGIEESREQYVS